MRNILFTLFLLNIVSLSYARITDAPDTLSKNDTVRLKEVVVKAPALKTVMEVDGNLTTVRGTELSKLATTFEVMKFIPGLIVSGESVEVAGVGGPVIYIDRRKVTDMNDIRNLSPDRIKTIKVIDNPGARYGGDVRAVILITTFRRPGEGLAVSDRMTLSYRDYLNPSNLLSLNFRSGNLDIFASLDYSHSHTKRATTVATELFTPTSSILSENSVASRSRSDRGEGKIGFNFSPDNKHFFGAYYQGSFMKSRWQTGNSLFRNYEDGYLTSAAYYDGIRHTRSPYHRINAFYSGKWGTWDCDINFDFIHRNSKGDEQELYRYTDNSTSPYSANDEKRDRFFAGKIDLTHKIGGGTLYLGTEVTNTDILSEFLNHEMIIPANTTRMNESNIGVYAEYSRKFGIVSVFGGLRYEYTWAKYRETVGEGNKVRRDYHELIPSLSVRVPWDKVTLRLSYSRMYNKPIYAWLTNSISYVNPNLYEAGNMYLKPAYFNFVNLSCQYRWLMLSLRYGYITGKVTSASVPYPDDPKVIFSYKINSPHPLTQLSAVATVTPGFIGRIYYPQLSAMIFPQYYKIDFCGKPMRFKNPMGRINFNNLLKFSESFNATLNFSWSSAGDVESGHHNGNWQLDLGITKSFGAHWTLQLNADDIFNTARTLKATSYTSQEITRGEWIFTRRDIRLSVTYRFNVRKSRYRDASAGEAEMERL